jgi:uncharacterized Zn finger protein
MPRELIDDKARRYLVEGRLRVTHVTNNRVSATCRGRASYALGRTNDHWWCECPARVRCAHIVALQHVVPSEPAVPQQRRIPSAS